MIRHNENKKLSRKRNRRFLRRIKDDNRLLELTNAI